MRIAWGVDIRVATIYDPATTVFAKTFITFNNKEFLCITHTVEHNCISPSGTLGIQLHVSALNLAIFRF